MKKIGNQIAKGAAWMVLFKFMEKSLGIVSTMILARLLAPQDFGLMAMAMSIIAGIELLYAFNFDVALIQKKDPTKAHYNTAWSLNLSLGVLSVALLALAAPFAAEFYEEERLKMVIYFLSLGVFIAALQNIGIVDFRRKLEFQKEFKWMLSRKLAGFCVTITLAIYYESYWALVYGILAGKSVGTLMSYAMHPFRPRISFSASKELIRFSGWLLINNVLFFLKIRSADFVIGRISGGYNLGLFGISYEISNMPTTELVAPINRAVFPGYASISDDIVQLQQGFLNVLAIIFLFALPVGTGIALTAEYFVPVMLGPKWLETIPLIQVLSFFGVITAIQTNVGSVFLAIGKPRILTMLAMFYVIFLLCGLVYTVDKWGIMGAAWTYLLVSSALAPVTYYMVLRSIKLRWVSILKLSWRPIISVCCMAGGVIIFKSLLLFNESVFADLFSLLSSALTGALIYLFTIILLWSISKKPDGAETLVFEKAAGMEIPVISRFSQSITNH